MIVDVVSKQRRDDLLCCVVRCSEKDVRELIRLEKVFKDERMDGCSEYMYEVLHKIFRWCRAAEGLVLACLYASLRIYYIFCFALFGYGEPSARGRVVSCSRQDAGFEVFYFAERLVSPQCGTNRTAQQ